MIKILILSRRVAEATFYHENDRVISVYTPGDTAPRFHNNKRVLWQGCFHDCDARTRAYHGENLSESDWNLLKPTPISEQQAKEIALAILSLQTMPEVDTLYVHCDAGISRSRGVGAAAEYILKCKNIDCDPSNIYSSGNPNVDVKRRIIRAYREI